MNRLISSVAGLLLLATPALKAQQDSTHHYKYTLGVKWGYHHYSRQDLAFSPMIYSSGYLANVEVLLEWRKSKTINKLTLAFDSPSLKWQDLYDFDAWPDWQTRTTLPTGHTMVNIRYEKLWKVGAGKNELFTGFVLDNQLNALDFATGDFSLFGYQMSFSLGPAVEWDIALGKRGTLAAIGQFALLNWVARSPYAINDDEYFRNNADHKGLKTFFRYLGSGELRTIDKFLKFNLGVQYSYEISPRWAALASYDFEALYYSEPRPVYAYRNNFNIGLTYKF